MIEKRSSSRINHLPIYDDEENDLGNLGFSNEDNSMSTVLDSTVPDKLDDKTDEPLQQDSAESSYENAIKDYKSRVSLACQPSCNFPNTSLTTASDHPQLLSKYNIISNDDGTQDEEKNTETILSKVHITKMKELFEKKINETVHQSLEKSRSKSSGIQANELRKSGFECEFVNNNNNNTNDKTNITDIQQDMQKFYDVSETNHTSIIQSQKGEFDLNDNLKIGDENITDDYYNVPNHDYIEEKHDLVCENTYIRNDEEISEREILLNAGTIDCKSLDKGKILDEALELALLEMDCMENEYPQNGNVSTEKHIYQNIENPRDNAQIKLSPNIMKDESHYQVPKNREPHYEVPKINRMPFYENVDLMFSENERNLVYKQKLSPPKEKPPPLPFDDSFYTKSCNEEAFSNSGSIEIATTLKNEIGSLSNADYIAQSKFIECLGSFNTFLTEENSNAPSPEENSLTYHHCRSSSSSEADKKIKDILKNRGETYYNNVNQSEVSDVLRPDNDDETNARIKRYMEQQSNVQPPVKPQRYYFYDQSHQEDNVFNLEGHECLPNVLCQNVNQMKINLMSSNDKDMACGSPLNQERYQRLSLPTIASSNACSMNASKKCPCVHADKSLVQCKKPWHQSYTDVRDVKRNSETLSRTEGLTCSYNSKHEFKKSLPESVIQSITERVQFLGIGLEKRRKSDAPRFTVESDERKYNICESVLPNDETIISVSGKKKCSHCKIELGRGAAMVIESLGLLYHIDCFKCCVCDIRLGDGLKGTDVRVRKYKLHCRNCFSSEDGVKFSCV
ncbi:MATH and LRR domain-containing protein PFE0570w isoform X2 [Uranotaenia lowii]|nr:MATH and LRR domain-containing protein PFE0570w isoform X2 [Uranotaenia lowii]